MAITVDAALVLAVDVSSSVDAGDYALQMTGIAGALLQPDIFEAISLGPHAAIALSLVQWSTASKQVVSLPWKILASLDDLREAAQVIADYPRDWRPGGTGMAAAIYFCTQLFDGMPFSTLRKVIDVSGDGEDNDHGDVPAMRGNAVARGITINGLPIVTGSATIADYYLNTVIGGPASFIQPAGNVLDFGEAMHRKLMREIQSPVT